MSLQAICLIALPAVATASDIDVEGTVAAGVLTTLCIGLMCGGFFLFGVCGYYAIRQFFKSESAARIATDVESGLTAMTAMTSGRAAPYVSEEKPQQQQNNTVLLQQLTSLNETMEKRNKLLVEMQELEQKMTKLKSSPEIAEA
jgi:hypothetical protein